MAWKAVIGGVDHTSDLRLEDEVTISLMANERSTAQFKCLPGYVPALRAEVTLYEQDGTTPIFGGIIWQRQTLQFEGITYLGIDLADWSAYADITYQTKTYTSPVTLKKVLQDLVADKLGAFGITLDATQPTGPTFEPFSWVNKMVSDCLRDLSDKTTPKYLSQWTPSKVLSMKVPTADAAPFNISNATPNCESLNWQDSGSGYATRVILECGPNETAVYNQEWTSTGTAGPWVADIPAAGPGGYWVVTATPPGNLYYTVDDGSGGGMMSWNWATRTLTSNIGAIAAGVVLRFPYTAKWPFTVIADAGITPAIEIIATAPSVLTIAEGQELADSLLVRAYQMPKTMTAITRLPGLLPRQSISVVLTSSLINAPTSFITMVGIQLVERAFWRYTATIVEGSEYLGSYLDFWRQDAGGGGGMSVLSAGGSGGGGSTPVSYLGGSRFFPVQVPA